MGLSSGGRGGGSVDTGGAYIRDSNWVTYLGGGNTYGRTYIQGNVLTGFYGIFSGDTS